MVIIRRETPADVAVTRAIQVAAFRQTDDEPVEARLLDELRASAGWIPELSLVAERDEVVVGHNVCTRGHVGDLACVGLGPIGIAPDVQRGGLGSALMHGMIGAADALGEPLIALLGSPDYYSRFGFVASIELGIEPPEEAWGVFFQALPLSAWDDAITGQFRYAEPFNNLD